MCGSEKRQVDVDGAEDSHLLLSDDPLSNEVEVDGAFFGYAQRLAVEVAHIVAEGVTVFRAACIQI